MLKGGRLASNARDSGHWRTVAQPLAELANGIRLATSEDLYPPVRQITCVARQPQAQSLLAGCGAKKDSLDAASHQATETDSLVGYLLTHRF
jgi:hypothetical protein